MTSWGHSLFSFFMTSAFLLELYEPRDAIVHNTGVERVNDKLAVPLGEDQIGLLQQIEVVGNGGLAYAKMVSDCAGREIATTQQVKDGAARRIVQSPENKIHHFDN
jgi:hypothetical protein